MALDAQGRDRVLPYVEESGATFTTALDEENLLGELYGFKAIPNGLLIDEEGILGDKVLSAFDVGLKETVELMERWLESSQPVRRGAFKWEEEELPGSPAALEHFRRGVALKQEGRAEEAVAEWKKGVQLEPDNYLLRKQVWAAEHPEKFYDGDVDFDWQDEQLKAGL